MATTKKTSPKKTPAKKTAMKEVGKPKPRSDYKPGARVKVKLRSGVEVKTFVEKIVQTPTGPFIHVNLGTKELPNVKGFRPAAVRGF